VVLGAALTAYAARLDVTLGVSAGDATGVPELRGSSRWLAGEPSLALSGQGRVLLVTNAVARRLAAEMRARGAVGIRTPGEVRLGFAALSPAPAAPSVGMAAARPDPRTIRVTYAGWGRSVVTGFRFISERSPGF
jgi:hypothetical protein